jgi:hypothetical protein
MWNYILPVGVIALFTLAKDWVAHQTNWRRGTVLGLILLVGIGSAVNNFYTNRRTATQHTKDQAEITGLKTAVDAANQSQQANTKQFVDAFGKLSQKVSDLQTQVATEALQKKLASVQAELQKTQKALAPGQKAKLMFSFIPFDPGVLGSRPAVPSTETAVPLNLDNTVHVEFTALNITDVEAVDGQYAIILCDECKFAAEPPGFAKLAGRPETERYIAFPKIPAQAQSSVASVDVLVPPYLNDLILGIMYRCRTCDLPRSKEGFTGTVHVRRQSPLQNREKSH